MRKILRFPPVYAHKYNNIDNIVNVKRETKTKDRSNAVVFLPQYKKKQKLP